MQAFFISSVKPLVYFLDHEKLHHDEKNPSAGADQNTSAEHACRGMEGKRQHKVLNTLAGGWRVKQQGTEERDLRQTKLHKTINEET